MAILAIDFWSLQKEQSLADDKFPRHRLKRSGVISFEQVPAAGILIEV
jgi:hypothetical protein